MLGAFMGTEILSKKYSVTKVVNLTIVLLFFALVFFWYSQVTETAFNRGVGYIDKTFTRLNQFFILESRRENVQGILGKGIIQQEIPQKIQFVFTWLTFTFIGIGVTRLVVKYKEMSFPELNFEKPDFLKDKFEVTYFMIALTCTGLLIATVALPFISTGYGIDRLYAVAITILSVFFVIGGIMVSRGLNQFIAVSRGKALKKNTSQVLAYLVILLVLIPYFFCITGVTYQMFGVPVPLSLTLTSEGRWYEKYYIHDQESCSAKWLKNYAVEDANIYGDIHSGTRLLSQGMIRSPKYAKALIEDNNSIKEGYIYLRYTGVVNGKLMDRRRQWHNITEYSHLFVGKSEIYDNGGSEIYK